jgi:hypothetical protein
MKPERIPGMCICIPRYIGSDYMDNCPDDHCSSYTETLLIRRSGDSKSHSQGHHREICEKWETEEAGKAGEQPLTFAGKRYSIPMDFAMCVCARTLPACSGCMDSNTTTSWVKYLLSQYIVYMCNHNGAL